MTSQVAAGGSGTYRVGNVQAGRGADRWGGWYLVAAYRQPGVATVRRIAVLDGLQTLPGSAPATNGFSLTLDEFTASNQYTGTVRGRLGLAAGEGELGYATEGVSLNGTPLTDALNPNGNQFNASITSNGAVPAKNPSYVNQLGYDADLFNIDGRIADGATSATLDVASSLDIVLPHVVVMSLDQEPAAPANSAPPTISGTAQHGQTPTGTAGTWTGTGPLTYAYQWRRCDSGGPNCVDIPGATASTYSAVPADIGSRLRLVVTATNSEGSTSATSAPTAVVAAIPPSNTALPTISGSAVDGSTLTAAQGGWSGSPTISYAYQWRRCDSAGDNCVSIAGATGSAYSLVAADVGSRLRVVVTATNGGGSASATSSATGVVTALAPANTALPAISGSAVDGSTLTAANGTWTGTAPLSFSHQWRRCDSAGDNCVDIAGATGSTYDLVAADVGSTIRVQVTASNDGGSESATSAATAEIEAEPPASAAPPTIAGTPQAGRRLTADPGSWSGTAPIDFAYRWQRCDVSGAGCVDIPGATGPDYAPGAGDVGATIRVVVTATNDGGFQSVASSPTAPITAAPGDGGGGAGGDTGGGGGGSGTTPPADPPLDPVEPSGAEDLSLLPGSLVAASRCVQTRGARVVGFRLSGKRLRFAVPAGGQVTPSLPLLVQAKGTARSLRGVARAVRTVSYQLGKTKLRSVRRAPWAVAVSPALLGRATRQTLTIRVTPRTGKPKVATVPISSEACPMLLSASYKRGGTGSRLGLRVDARSAMTSIAFRVRNPLLPKALRKRATVGRMRLVLASGVKRSFKLSLLRSGKRISLTAGPGGPTLKLGRGAITVTGLPAGTGIVELSTTAPSRRPRRIVVSATVRAEGMGARRLRQTIGSQSKRR